MVGAIHNIERMRRCLESGIRHILVNSTVRTYQCRHNMMVVLVFPLASKQYGPGLQFHVFNYCVVEHCIISLLSFVEAVQTESPRNRQLRLNPSVS